MSGFQSWLNTLGAIGGPLLILWQLVKTKRDAVAAAGRAERAATDAAVHVKIVAESQSTLAANMAELTLNTNSIKDALVAATATASHLEGREEMRSETEAAKRENT